MHSLTLYLGMVVTLSIMRKLTSWSPLDELGITGIRSKGRSASVLVNRTTVIELVASNHEC